MIKSIKVKNYLNKEITLVLTRPEESGLIVKSVEGLGPAKANINVTDISTGDGGIFNSSRLDKRNIVMNLGFLSSPTESIEDVRQKTYMYFPIKKKVHLTVETDNHTIEADGYVESNEPDIFSQNEGCSISIICPDPFFYSQVDNTTSFSGIEPSFHFPFANDSVPTNLLSYPYADVESGKSVTVSGVTFTDNGDGTITVNGTPTDNMLLFTLAKATDFILDSGTYTISGCPAGGSMSKYGIWVTSITGDTAYDYGSGVTLSLSSQNNVWVQIMISTTVNNLVFSPNIIAVNSIDPDTPLLEMGVIQNKTGQLIIYDGNSEIGMTIHIHALGEATNISIINVLTGDKMIIDTDRLKAIMGTETAIIDGDTITINTTRGDKSITLLRDGVTTNILNCLGKGSKWFTLTKGDNIFSYDADTGASNLQFDIVNKVAYDGV